MTSQPRTEVVHQCPPTGSHTMPCCGKEPVEVPLWHRFTLTPELVTCEGVKSGTEGSEGR